MKVDLKKELASYHARRGVFEIIEVPPLRYLMIDGHGDPNAQAFEDALTTLYSDHDRDYVVMPLEALWWADDMAILQHRSRQVALGLDSEVHPRPWTADDRPASRDLLERPPSYRPCEAAHDPASARGDPSTERS